MTTGTTTTTTMTPDEVMAIESAHVLQTYRRAPVVDAALERGLLINRTADTVLRLLPPYVVDVAAVDQMAVVLDAALSAAEGENR
jgi:acetylornithine/succinyldiaminopimelate/putrescine aminotransferase